MIGIFVFVFYQFNTPPVFFNKTEVDRVQQYAKSDYNRIEAEHKIASEQKKIHATELLAAFDRGEEQAIEEVEEYLIDKRFLIKFHNLI